MTKAKAVGHYVNSIPASIEARKGGYDEALMRYERAATMSQISLNMLNLGQATIIALGLTVIMLLAGGEVTTGKMTVGAPIRLGPVVAKGTIYVLTDTGRLIALR